MNNEKVTAKEMISALKNVEGFVEEYGDRFKLGTDFNLYYYLDADKKYDLSSARVPDLISSLSDDLAKVRFAAGKSPVLSTNHIRSIGQILIAFADLLER